MGKKTSTDDAEPRSTEHCAIIAKPLAPPKLNKKLLKLCKKATKKKQVKRGVKEVVKAVRKKQKGCALALLRAWHLTTSTRLRASRRACMAAHCVNRIDWTDFSCQHNAKAILMSIA